MEIISENYVGYRKDLTNSIVSCIIIIDSNNPTDTKETYFCQI